MEYVGIDWASRRAAWCALDAAGELLGEGVIAADLDGLTRLVARRGPEVSAAVEMMSGAVWVADTLRAAGWRVQVADARRAKALAPLAAKTDRIDARVLAEPCRRELVPELWVASLDDRALRERLLRRMHLVRLRTSATAGCLAAVSVERRPWSDRLHVCAPLCGAGARLQRDWR